MQWFCCGLLLLAAQNAAAPLKRECVPFAAERLSSGSSFTAALPLGLELRLRFAGGGWDIAAGPADDRTADYLAPVSPPYRSPLHLRIGPGYGLTAEDSLHITPRELRFALTRGDAQLAWDIASAGLLGDMRRWKDMATITTGTLTLRITDSRAEHDVIEWIALSGEACIPVK
jgi:hypothetical protein